MNHIVAFLISIIVLRSIPAGAMYERGYTPQDLCLNKKLGDRCFLAFRAYTGTGESIYEGTCQVENGTLACKPKSLVTKGQIIPPIY